VTYLGIYLIAGLGFLLRIINLGVPKGLVFDEVYYVDAARDYLAFGVEVTKICSSSTFWKMVDCCWNSNIW
jgi:hypothetical protein